MGFYWDFFFVFPLLLASVATHKTLHVTWADTSLISATTLLLVLRHLCYVGRHVLCYDTSITWADTYCASAPMFSTVQYLRVPIVLRPSHSLLLVYTDKHFYDKNMNNEQ